MYLHSVYIHWNIWLNELFHMINLHWGSLLPTQALNLLKVAKPPAKWCHSEQRVRGSKWHAALVMWECSQDIYKARGMVLSTSSRRALWGCGQCLFFCYVFFSNQQLQGKQVVFSRQTLVSRQSPICFCLCGFGAAWTSSNMLLALWPDYPELC